MAINIETGWTVKNFSFGNAKEVCHEHFEESCFEAELQTILGFRTFKCPKLGAVPTKIILIPHRAILNKREKKGHRSEQKRRQYL